MNLNDQPKPQPKPQQGPYCEECGSTNVTKDASARWDVAAQDWSLSGLQDCEVCDDCGGENIGWRDAQ